MEYNIFGGIMIKHIVCLGDSNTHGYAADTNDTMDGSNRFNEEERWTRLLEKELGEEDYLVLEEGLGGRTTVFRDPLHEGMDALGVIYPILMSHEPVDLLIIMLGTNDTKERFNASPLVISCGLERLIKKAKDTECWRYGKPNILVICPPPIREEFKEVFDVEWMGSDCVRKSRELPYYYEKVCERSGVKFFNAVDCEFNKVDCMHLTRKGHRELMSSIVGIVRDATRDD
jgi:lysophospholipase L1-like esterase